MDRDVADAFKGDRLSGGGTAFPVNGGDAARLVNVHDWAATPLGPIAAWPRALRAATDLVLRGGFPMVLLWGPELTVAAYNDAYRRLLGDKPEALGRGFLDVWPEARDIIEPEIERALQGEAVCRETIHFSLRRRGELEDAWFDYQFSPVQDDDGRVAGILNIGVETTERVIAERSLAGAWATLREGEGRPAFLLALGETLRVEPVPAVAKKIVARLLAEHLRADRVIWYALEGEACVVESAFVSSQAQVEGRAAGTLTDPSIFGWDGVRDKVTVVKDAAREARAPTSVEAGAYIAVPLLRAGRFRGGLAVCCDAPRDWTTDETALVMEVAERCLSTGEQARAEALMRDSEARYRGLFEAIDEGFCVLEFRFDPGGRADYRVWEANAAFYEQTGFPKDILRQWLREAAPDLEEHWYEVYGQVAQTRQPVRFEQSSDMLGRWFNVYAFPIGAPEDLQVAVLFSDISERKRAETRQTMLMAELDHRVKNILAVVQSMIRQSLGRGKAADPGAADQLVGRLNALAQSHALLASSRWEGAQFREIFESAIAAYRGEREGRIDAAGPDLMVTPKAAQTLNLALYELVTNAAKYGALSREEGRVTVEWALTEAGETEGEAQKLGITWRERGGPRIAAPPTRKGFGSRLIEQTLAYELGGAVVLDFAPEGLCVTMDLPLDRLRVADDAGVPPPRPKAAPAAGDPAVLQGKRILVVEDEHLVAQATVEGLKYAGCSVVGPLAALLEALEAAATAPLDGAVLDINLGGELIWPAAHALRARGIPFIFTTGYSDTIRPPSELQDAPRVEKPVRRAQLLTTLAAAVEAGSG
jgi:two-component sensor histidine kinase/CheY-like chemotaxis protein/GAF domain-containing protein